MSSWFFTAGCEWMDSEWMPFTVWSPVLLLRKNDHKWLIASLQLWWHHLEKGISLLLITAMLLYKTAANLYQVEYRQNDPKPIISSNLWLQQPPWRCSAHPHAPLSLSLCSRVRCAARRLNTCSTSTCPPAPACWTWPWRAAAARSPSTAAWPHTPALAKTSPAARRSTRPKQSPTRSSTKAFVLFTTVLLTTPANFYFCVFVCFILI